jgi:ribosomal protein S1
MQENKSSRKAPQHRNSSEDTPKWAIVRTLVETGTTTTAKVDSVATKDGRPRGLNVTLECGLASFVPGSEIDKGVNQTALVGQTIEVKVIEATRRRSRLISSLSKVAGEKRAAFLGSLVENQEIEGTVVRTTDFGYFVDLGVVDGLLHVSQTALVDGKPEVLTKGQKVTARVRSVDLEKGQVGLTMRKPRPENAGNGGRGRQHGNRVEQFTTRTERRSAPLPKITASPVVKREEKPKGPRKLNTGGKKSRKNDFAVAFDSSGGNPFEQLATYWQQQHGSPAPETSEAPAPAAATTDAQ